MLRDSSHGHLGGLTIDKLSFNPIIFNSSPMVLGSQYFYNKNIEMKPQIYKDYILYNVDFKWSHHVSIQMPIRAKQRHLLYSCTLS